MTWTPSDNVSLEAQILSAHSGLKVKACRRWLVHIGKGEHSSWLMRRYPGKEFAECVKLAGKEITGFICGTTQAEQTPEGMQTLIPGVDPLAPADPLVAERVARAEKRKRNQHKAGGLFDEGALAQTDLADFISEKVIFVHVK